MPYSENLLQTMAQQYHTLKVDWGKLQEYHTSFKNELHLVMANSNLAVLNIKRIQSISTELMRIAPHPINIACETLEEVSSEAWRKIAIRNERIDFLQRIIFGEPSVATPSIKALDEEQDIIIVIRQQTENCIEKLNSFFQKTETFFYDIKRSELLAENKKENAQTPAIMGCQGGDENGSAEPLNFPILTTREFS